MRLLFFAAIFFLPFPFFSHSLFMPRDIAAAYKQETRNVDGKSKKIKLAATGNCRKRSNLKVVEDHRQMVQQKLEQQKKKST